VECADLVDVGREVVDHPPGVWFSEDCHARENTSMERRVVYSSHRSTRAISESP
jgi:hypothetical protein